MLVHRRVTSSIIVTGTHLYNWVGRGSMRLKCLSQEDKAVPRHGLNPDRLIPDPSALTVQHIRYILNSKQHQQKLTTFIISNRCFHSLGKVIDIFIFTNRSGVNELVTLHFDSKRTSVLCHFGNFGCGDGGWTPVMKIDGKKVRHLPTFYFLKLYSQYVARKTFIL